MVRNYSYNKRFLVEVLLRLETPHSTLNLMGTDKHFTHKTQLFSSIPDETKIENVWLVIDKIIDWNVWLSM